MSNKVIATAMLAALLVSQGRHRAATKTLLSLANVNPDEVEDAAEDVVDQLETNGVDKVEAGDGIEDDDLALQGVQDLIGEDDDEDMSTEEIIQASLRGARRTTKASVKPTKTQAQRMSVVQRALAAQILDGEVDGDSENDTVNDPASQQLRQTAKLSRAAANVAALRQRRK